MLRIIALLITVGWGDAFGQSTMRTKGMSNAALNLAPPERAVSSVGERFLDTEEVTCSIHVPPTMKQRLVK
jgi:hypothetical protein